MTTSSNTSIRTLLEEGLRRAIKAREERPQRAFRMQIFLGDDPTEAFGDAPWEPVRDEIYRGRV